MSGVSGDVQGFNLYVYCFNNPVVNTDVSGNWPSWNDFWNGVGNFFYNIGEAVLMSIEAEVSINEGVNVKTGTVGGEACRKTYIGLDDGKIITGTAVEASISFLQSFFEIGYEGNHLSEQGGKRVSSYGEAEDGPFDMLLYPDTVHTFELNVGPISVNQKGDFVFKLSTKNSYVGIGGKASVGINITEFIVRLFD